MMDLKAYRNARWSALLILVLIVMILVACGSRDEDEALPEGCDGVTWGNGIEVEEQSGDYIAIVRGDYPDSCSEVCGSEQEVDGNTININVFSSKPEGMMCSQMLTPFVTQVPLDTEDLDPGEYTVTLNETHATTTFTLE